MGLKTGETAVEADFAVIGAKAIQSSGTTVNNLFGTMAFQAEDYDSSGFHDNVTNNTRLTVPAGKGGKYLIGASFKVISTSGKQLGCLIRLNGSTILASQISGTGIDNVNAVSITTFAQLAAGDYVELLVVAGSSDTSTGDAQCNFWLNKIIEA